MKHLSYWKTLWIVVLIGFILVNVYVSYLSSRIVPFETSIPLHNESYAEKFNIDSFHSASYTMMLALNHPERTSLPPLMDWEQAEKQLRADFDVTILIKLRDSKDRQVIDHVGNLNDWTITNHGATANSDGAFYKYYFDAKVFEDYQLEIEVINSNNAAGIYKPTILFHGIDDGYFWLIRPLFNLYWAVFIGLIATIVFVVRCKRTKMQPNKSLNQIGAKNAPPG